MSQTKEVKIITVNDLGSCFELVPKNPENPEEGYVLDVKISEEPQDTQRD